MAGPPRSGPTPTDPGAGRRAWRPAWGYLVLALAVLAAGLGYGLMPSTSPAPAPVAVDAAPAAAPVPTSSGPTPNALMHAALAASVVRGPSAATPSQVSRTRDPNGDLTPDLSDYVNNGERPTMAEVIERLHQAGVHGGLGAFSPPGTRPPLVGLAVPEDFELPDGYVRHYQATDDGQRIEPILMFAPDRQFFDAAHQPIAIPADRVVPPELAPPGLPIRRIVIPAPTEPGSPGR